jgi:predicted dienelactone hydrolase
MTSTRLLNPFKYLAAIALVVLAAGCATSTISDENLAVAAGFKVITPTKPDQQAILAKLPKDKVSPVTYEGATYYVLPDSMNNLAYVGGPSQYQAYQQLRVQKQLSNDNLQAAQMNEMNNMNWGTWGGWGGVGFVGIRR